MKTARNILWLLLVVACVDPYEIKNAGPADMLVVEGVFSNQLKAHSIYLSRAVPFNEKRQRPETGATLTIIDDTGEVIALTEEQPGHYQTPLTAAIDGREYRLHILTMDGSTYESSRMIYKDGPDINNVYVSYKNNPHGEGKGLQVYVDTEDPTGQTRFYRWNYIETYEVHAPFPSNWIWLGGQEVEFRHEGIDTCYVTDTLRNVLIRNTQNLEQDKVTGQEVRFIPEESYITRYRYSILVQQFCLSEQSYRYWDNLRTVSEQQGTLSDIQPGSITGNVFSLTNPGETVLGYFDVGCVSEKRIFFSAINFFNDGMKMPPAYRNNCDDIKPVTILFQELPALMPLYERTMNIWEVDDTPVLVANLLPKSCTDCRDQGSTKKPPFF